ncbi:MAG: PKD domain-containing protein [Saprospiraceae bacterium]
MVYAKFISVLLLCVPVVFYAQKHDNIWLFGGDGGDQTPATDSGGVTMLDFSEIDRPKILNLQSPKVWFYGTNASICDSVGNLLFYTNGEHVYRYNHQKMPPSTALVDNGTGQGYRIPQGAITLPFPDHSGQYVVISTEFRYMNGTVSGWKLFSHTVDMLQNNGLGKLTQVRHLLVQDTFSLGMITATKHANGRDWWFVVPKSKSNIYYIGLLSPNGIKIDTFNSCLSIKDGFGQATFTPDGSKYIRAEDDDLLTPNQVSILDFDRCEGKLNNCQTKFLGLNTFGTGSVVSANSKYLYVMDTYRCLQYDLQSQDVFSTELLVEIWDSSRYYIWPTDFYLSQLAPDGRIYINTTNGSTSMHYINFPNRLGPACQFVQNGILTPTLIQYEMPNFSNFRLGPIDGSPCDTLGLDNHPLANFRWEQEDSTELLHITFTDLSAYEPETWHWTFGDGSESQDTSPVHTYAQPDVYEVCLVVRNQNSADTICRAVNVGVSSTNDDQAAPFEVVAYPNPFSDRLILQLKGLDYLRGEVDLFDVAGQLVSTKMWNGRQLDWYLGHLVPGVYFYRARTDRGVLKTGKIVKM